MSEDKPQGYYLTQDVMDSARLSYQHQCVIARQGYYIHPTILSALCSDIEATSPVHILDLATGNAIWAIELAESLSRTPAPLGQRPVEIVGLDISTKQFPAKPTLPSNVTLDTLDIFADIPEQYENKFDVVHVRFLQAILWQDEQRGPTVLRKLSQLLRPGGYLQWTEPPPPMFYHVVGFNADGSCKLAEEELEFLQTIDKFTQVSKKVMWLNQLDKLVADSGLFTDAHGYWPPAKKERIKYENDLLFWNSEAVRPNLLKVTGLPAAAKEQIDNEWGVLSKELETGSTLVAMMFIVVVGRKI